MRPAEHNEPAAPAKSIGQVIDVAGVRGVARDSDQVGGGVEIDGLVVFIHCAATWWGLRTKPAR